VEVLEVREAVIAARLARLETQAGHPVAAHELVAAAALLRGKQDEPACPRGRRLGGSGMTLGA